MKSNKSNIWLKIIFISIIFSALAVCLGFYGTHLVFDSLLERPEKNLVATTANLIKDIKNKTNKDYDYIIKNYSAKDEFVQLSIVNKAGDKRFDKLKINESFDEKRDGPFKKIYFNLDNEKMLVFEFGPHGLRSHMPPPPEMKNGGPRFEHVGPGGDRGPGFPNGGRGNPTKWFMLIPVTLTFLILFLVLTFAAVVMVIISRKQALLVKDVMNELKMGNLKSRLQINKFDEVSGLMLEFNSMADEIEKLVIDLKDTDQVRRNLLQELSHDLRTPIASVKSMLETNLNFDTRMTSEERIENLKLSIKEIDYFHRLVEDLLFLSGVHDLSFRGNFKKVNVVEIISHEISVQEEINDKIKLNLHLDSKHEIIGDEYLLKRLFKNAISNAMAHARKEVDVYIKKIDENKVEVRIDDDGVGFNEADMSDFGKKRATRRLNHDESGRISIGLGSVIMNKICEIHSGVLKIKNRKVDEKIIGARVCIVLNIQREIKEHD